MSDNTKAQGDQENIRRLLSEGAQLLAARRAGEAAACLEQAWALDSRNVAIAINLGGAYILQGKHNRAVSILEVASRLEPENVMVWTNLAAAYLGKLPFATEKRQNQAIAAYERALTIDPLTPHAHYNLALIYLERRDRQRAVAHFTRALDTNPTDRDAQRYLNELLRGSVDETSTGPSRQAGDGSPGSS